MKATLKNYRQSPRKVRLVTDLVKGKKLNQAKVLLDFTNKRASKMVKKLLLSAEANALSKGMKSEDLYVKNITVDEGITLKRMRARAMGRGVIVRKRTSLLNVTLGDLDQKKAGKSGKKAKTKTTKEKKVLKKKSTGESSKGKNFKKSKKAKS